jgi:adenosylcobinamide-GDP ribazoletransferase
MNSLRHFLLAIQFFTRIPITGGLALWVGFSDVLLARCSAYLPLIGSLVGLLSATIFFVFMKLLPNYAGNYWVAIFMAIVVSILITGALHEDGLADLVDGLGGSATREKALEIMKDSRVGSYGSIALTLIILGKFIFLSVLAGAGLAFTFFAIIAASIFSRFLVLVAMTYMPYSGDQAFSKSMGMFAGPRLTIFTVGTLWTAILFLIIYFCYSSWVWVGGIILSMVVLLLILRIVHLRLGGVNGDALGFIQQVTEVGFYLGLLLIPPSLAL